MDFKKKVAEFVDCFKNIGSFDFLGRLKTIVKDIPGLIALAGATLMLIGAFVPNFHQTVSFWGMSESVFYNLFQAGGWYVFVLTLIALGLAYFKQTFWAGATAALALTLTVIQGITFSASIAVPSYLSSYGCSSGVHVGWFFILLGGLPVIGAFVLEEFVFAKKAAPAVAAPAAAPVAAPVETPVAPVEAPVAPVAEVTENTDAQ